MAVRKVRKFLTTAEEFLEDLILILLSLVIVILSVSALAVLASGAPAEVSQRAEQLSQTLPQLTFLAKAEYFATLVFPWVLMLIGLLIFRELWFLRRAIERIEFRKLLESASTPKRKRR